jgi:PBP1b-binding outer membrane lipoprotein LpoB
VPAFPALISIALIGLFVSACNEEPRTAERSEPKAEARAQAPESESPIVRKAPRMLDPTKPGGSGAPRS